MSSQNSLYIAELVIYIIFLQPTLYCFWKHSKRGFLGWFYLQLFCIVRIVGAAYTIHADATHASSTAGLIISSVGLSPLLLTLDGILHEARASRNPSINRKIEWFLVIQYHLLVSGALGLIIAGVVFLESSSTTVSHSTTSILIEVGSAFVIVCWLLLIIWTHVTMSPSQRDVEAPAYNDGTKLVWSCILALPFVGMRVAYSVATLIIEVKHGSDAFTTSLAAKVCLSVVPEMIVVLLIIVAGILTRRIKQSTILESRIHVEPKADRSVA